MKKNMPIHKTFLSPAASIKSIDEENMIIDHAISDDAEDRDGDDIALDAWQTDNYMRNPVVLDAHDYTNPAIGKCIALYKEGNQLRAKTQFAPTERGKTYFELYKGGFMSAFSVGFIPFDVAPKGQRGCHVTSCELLEYSCVPVPANPRALKRFDADEKRGAVLNKANLDLLRQAADLINQVIRSADAEEDGEAENEETTDDPKALLYFALKSEENRGG